MSENNRYFCDCGKDDKDMYNCGCKKDNCKKDDKCHNDHKCCEDKKHHDKKCSDECCCKLSLIKALELLGCEANDLINFNAAAFITDYYVAGGNLALFEPNPLINNLDNLNAALTGTLKKLPDCNCDILDIDANTVYPIPLPTDLISLVYGLIDFLAGLIPIVGAVAAAVILPIITALVAVLNFLLLGTTDIVAITNYILSILVRLITTLEGVDTASLCEIRALAFDLVPDATVNGGACCVETNYARLRRELKCILKEKCPTKVDCKPDCDPCCCDKGVLSQVAGSNIASTVSLTVGTLTLENVEVLGTVCNAIILAAPPAAATTTILPGFTIPGLPDAVPPIGPITVPEVTLPVAATPGRIYIVCADAVTFID